jgi:hypothetical protein
MFNSSSLTFTRQNKLKELKANGLSAYTDLRQGKLIKSTQKDNCSNNIKRYLDFSNPTPEEIIQSENILAIG